MPIPRVFRANAIVLRRINLAETDKIVTLFTRERGKLSAVAKGARRPTSRLAGAIELFGYCRVMLAAGQHLDVLTQVEVRESFPSIRADLRKIATASFLAELTDHLTAERLPQEEIFDLLLSALYVLNIVDEPGLLVAAFTLKMLAFSGYTPALTECARCRATGRDLSTFSPSMGGVVCGDCRFEVTDAFPVSGEAVGVARRMLELELPGAARISASRPARSHLLRMVRAFATYHTERPMKSARFLDELLAAEKVNGA